jgi:hypothetical protein
VVVASSVIIFVAVMVLADLILIHKQSPGVPTHCSAQNTVLLKDSISSFNSPLKQPSRYS